MKDNSVVPSELHLKKEFTALRNAPFLRDPETYSSWRSPLSSRSVASFSPKNYIRGSRGSSTTSAAFFDLPLKDPKKKKVYLYNWGNHSPKSSDSGWKLGKENRQESFHGCPRDKHFLTSYSVRVSNSDASARAARKSRSAVCKKLTIRNSNMSETMDLPSNSQGILHSCGYSENAAYFNSKHLCRKARELARGNCSPFCSPYHSNAPTPASSYERYKGRTSRISGVWEETSASTDEDLVNHLDLCHGGCSITHSSVKNLKEKGCSGFYPHALCDAVRQKQSNILPGTQSLHSKRRSIMSCKKRYILTPSKGVPLLTSNSSQDVFCENIISDEMSNKLELDLEGLSRLNEKTWSSSRSQGLQLSLPKSADPERVEKKSLSDKYTPRSFDDIIGQNMIVQSLKNSILTGRVALAYLFHGPRGTGKTSVARIFAAALNCISNEEDKPCGFCRECTDMAHGTGSNIRQVDGTHQKAMERLRPLLRKMSITKSFPQYKVIIVDECHMLSSKIWLAFMKYFREPPSQVAFIFITTDPDNMPQAVVSICQQYHFSKIQDADIVYRLRMLSREESLDVEMEALDFISLNSDGSLRNAELMLDQLTLLGRRITTTLVNDLIGVVSEEKLLYLLESAMKSDTAETVKRSRELLDSGVDPVALTSKLARLIMDIMAGTHQLATSQVSKLELDKLHHSLKILSNAGKQLRLLSERSTWFTAALLQLGLDLNKEPTRSSTSSRKSLKKNNDGVLDLVKEASPSGNKPSEKSSTDSVPDAKCSQSLTADNFLGKSKSVDGTVVDDVHNDHYSEQRVLAHISPLKLEEIWRRSIDRCHSMTLRQLLSIHGKLMSIIEVEGTSIAYIAFKDDTLKSRAEGFVSSIKNSIQMVLGHNVEVRIGLLTENLMKLQSSGSEHLPREHMIIRSPEKDGMDVDQQNIDLISPRKTLYISERMLQEIADNVDKSMLTDSGAVDKQKLENSWPQAVRKGEKTSTSYLKARYGKEASLPRSVSSKLWEEDVSPEIQERQADDTQSHQLESLRRTAHRYLASPSSLHRYSFNFNSDNESLSYRSQDSGTGCKGFLCWKTRKPQSRKAKQPNHFRSKKAGCLP